MSTLVRRATHCLYCPLRLSNLSVQSQTSVSAFIASARFAPVIAAGAASASGAAAVNFS